MRRLHSIIMCICLSNTGGETVLKRRSWHADPWPHATSRSAWTTCPIHVRFTRSLSTEAGGGSRVFSTCISGFPSFLPLLLTSLRFHVSFLCCMHVHAIYQVSLCTSVLILSSSNVPLCFLLLFLPIHAHNTRTYIHTLTCTQTEKEPMFDD